VRGTNNKEHVLENLCKGILRAKYGLCVNKDGTIRYDMTELPITHFKPSEIGTSVEKLKELGYEEDIYGRKLVSDEQIVELKPQDIIIPKEKYTDEPADLIMFRISKFIDELLEKFYKLKPFYNLKSPEELVGHLVIGLAPHTSAGIVCRIIGFSRMQAILAHPLCHAAMRRDCDGDETSIILLMDGFLNFSRQYLPDKRGGRTMDSPLVLTQTIVSSEVDDMVYKLDVVSNYPLELYNAALNYKMPSEVNVETLGKRLGTYKQYEGFLFTHPTANINSGILCSSYKTLPTMEEKIKGQMKIAELLRAVDSTMVAELIIEKHLLKDLRGNLRKFSRQQFRCVKCNKKYRRMPFAGKCECGGRIIFTISEGSIIKYLEPALSIAEKYNVSTYLKQSLELTKNMIESVFGKEKEKQQNLGRWFG
jgi:DNA polymerase II large subunit